MGGIERNVEMVKVMDISQKQTEEVLELLCFFRQQLSLKDGTLTYVGGWCYFPSSSKA